MVFSLHMSLFIAGWLHFAVLIASAMVPGVLDWRNELARLSALTRQRVWVHGAFIVLVIIGFGVTTILTAEALANGSTLSRSVSGSSGLFRSSACAAQV